MDELHDDTGKCCVWPSSPSRSVFSKPLRNRSRSSPSCETRRGRCLGRSPGRSIAHIGVCYDVCHQSVEFEDVAASIRELGDHDIRINKVHITLRHRAAAAHLG